LSAPTADPIPGLSAGLGRALLLLLLLIRCSHAASLDRGEPGEDSWIDSREKGG